MNISEFCIRRPVFTTLLMAALLVAGIAGYGTLPVSALPNVDSPTIQVEADLSGASPETIASSVATPLERQFSTISGISSMISTSFLGHTEITLTFDLDRDIDGAALDVQTAISTALRKLPKELTTAPEFRKVNPAASPVLFIAVSSDTLPLSKVDEYADTLMAERISMLPGVAQATIFGEKKYAVRIQVDPNRLAAQGLGLNQVNNAIAAAASNAPLGSIYGPRQLFNIDLKGQPVDADGFRNLIAVWKNGAPVRLGDIASVIDDVADEHQSGSINNKPAVIIAIQRQPDANTVGVVRRVRELLPTFRQELPSSIQITPMFDRSVGINQSVHDVERTLVVTFILVVLVIFLFLRSARATIIPAMAVPLSIVATFAGMSFLKFSLDNVSLLALTLCVGFVVDDAIVMLENIVRHIENGEKVYEAALKGSREIGFTIISMTCSLIAVFIPVLFMGGVVGRMFREFALTISMAILFSGMIALTLSPMLCSRLLRTHHEESRFSKRLESVFQWMMRIYEYGLKVALHHRAIMLLVTLGMLAASIVAFELAPKGFFPQEDTGFVSVKTEAAQDISFDAMLEKQKQAAQVMLANPFVKLVFASTGGSGKAASSGSMCFGLKDGARPSVTEVIKQLRKSLSKIEGFKVYMNPVQNIQIGGRPAKSLYQYTLQDNDLDELYSWSNKLIDRLAKEPGFQDVTSDLQLRSLEAVVTIDQQKAARAGVTYDDVRQTLYGAFGTQQVASLYSAADTYEVICEVAPPYQKTPEDIANLYVAGTAPGNSGQVVPLSAIAAITRGVTALTINHQGQLPAVTISFNITSGLSLGEAVDRIAVIKKDMGMPERVTSNFQGTAQAFQDALNGQGVLLAFAVVIIYIILGMLYESFIHPITILSGLPSAGLGAILTLILFHYLKTDPNGMDINPITIIGMILLIGIVKKNSIMMVDFAVNERARGEDAEKAIYQACVLRFRPIMMTTMAAIFGTLPIAFSLGAGSELRQPLGVAVVGGLLLSQLLTLFITPVVYLYLEELQNWIRQKTERPAQAEQA